MSESYDVIIIGAGISGLATAYRLQQAGKSVLILEKEERVGGCFHSEVVPDDAAPFWLEMGTHTCFNSYGRLLTILDELGLKARMQDREKLRYRMLTDGGLASIPSRLRFLELFTHAWRIFSMKKDALSVADYYRAIVGDGNYRNVFRHAFNAVICQQADDVPADMLFRKRPRNKSVMRSYTFPTGLGDVTRALEKQLTCRKGVQITGIEKSDQGYRVSCGDAVLTCQQLVCATPAPAASRLLAGAEPLLAEHLQWVHEVEVESVGVVVSADQLKLEPLAGIIAADGDFWSAVSRDIVAHPQLRGITFHFKPGLLDDEAKLERIASILRLDRADMLYHFFKVNRLPSPSAGHHALMQEVDALLAGKSLALVGNYFAGVAVEDCLERVESELLRVFRITSHS